jgi:hypothetical protein
MMTDENNLIDENSLINEITDGRITEVLAEHETPPINRTAGAAAMADLNRDYFVAKVGGGTFVFDERDRPLLANAMTFTAFKQFMASHRNGGQVAANWLKWRDRRTYAGIVFDPSNRNPPNTYNTWRGLAVPPRKGECRLIKNHIRYVWCSGNDDQCVYVIKWMALMVQRPWVKPEVALVLPSVEGTGKNIIIIGVLAPIFGEHAFITAQKEQVAGRFNGHLYDKVLVVPNKALFAGDPAAVAAVKALVTDTTIGYESKGKPAFSAANYAHVIIPTNNDWAVNAGPDARRWMVCDVSEARKGDLAYFANLAAEIENGGVAAFLHWLLGVDLTGFNPRAFPISKALAAQRAQTMERTDPVGAFLMQALAAGEFRTQHGPGIPWSKEVAAWDLQDSYMAATARVRYAPGFAFAMKRLRTLLPPRSLRTIRKRQGHGRSRYYQLPQLKAARTHFQCATGIDLPTL